jgi:hypothetical protein
VQLVAQICMILITIALLGIAGLLIRLMFQTQALIENANRALAELPAVLEQTRQASARADELLQAFSRITSSVEASVSRFERLSSRSSALTTMLFDEVERPVSHAVRAIRGFQAGASHLIQRWKSHAGSRSHSNEREHHDGEQQWLDDGGGAGGSGDRGRARADLRADGR